MRELKIYMKIINKDSTLGDGLNRYGNISNQEIS